MDKYITMSQKEVKRYDIIKKLINRELKEKEVSSLLKLTSRHIRRLKKRVNEYGIKGLTHGNRGKTSNHKMPDEERQKIVYLINKYYSDFGPLLASEKLEEKHKIKRDKSTIRTIMINENIWTPKKKKKEKHREWRQRKASFGEMIQYDGSYEYWFEDRGEKYCLLACIDDANSRVWMKFDKHEGVEPTFNFWREYIERFGKPYSIYVDRFSTYSMNHKLAKENPDTLTQFQRAMEKDLNIEIIHAGSAEAKGRVERMFQTLQDRLIKELRLAGITNIKDANKFLEKYIPKFNTKFAVAPKRKSDLHKKVNKQTEEKLPQIFSIQDQRKVNNDYTVMFKNNFFQLDREQTTTVYKKDTVIVEEHLDETIKLRLRDNYLNYKTLPERPKKEINIKLPALTKQKQNSAYKPPADHPWKKQFLFDKARIKQTNFAKKNN